MSASGRTCVYELQSHVLTPDALYPVHVKPVLVGRTVSAGGFAATLIKGGCRTFSTLLDVASHSFAHLLTPFLALFVTQVDAPLNNGSWGGPLFDAGGRVVGMAFQKFPTQTWMER